MGSKSSFVRKGGSDLTNQVRSFSDLVAKCPECSRPLKLDEMGVPTCRPCKNELDIDMEAVIDLMGKILEQDFEIHILVPGAEKFLRRLFERI